MPIYITNENQVPTVDSTNNNTINDAIGNKSDTVAGTSLIGQVKLIDANVDSIKTKTDALPDSVWTGTLDTTPTPGSRECSLMLGGGVPIEKNFTIDGNGAQTDNLYSFTGTIEIDQIKIKIGVVTDATTFSDVKFDLNDGTNSVDLTDTVDGSATVQGSSFLKLSIASEPTVHIKADSVALQEDGVIAKDIFPRIIIQAKYGVTNYIRLRFTGDANTSISATACIIWKPISNDASVTAL